MDLLHLLIQIVVVGLICAVLLWGIREIGLAEPFNKAAKVVVVVIAVVFLLNILLSISGMPSLRLR